MTKQNDKHLRILDIITHEVARLELDDPEPRKEDQQWAESVVADMQARIAEHRKNRLPKTVPPIKKAEPISKRLAAMPRAALESLVAVLTPQLGPDAQLAFRNLEDLSDNDLRRLVQRMEKAGATAPRG
jgi:hypothetical protein